MNHKKRPEPPSEAQLRRMTDVELHEEIARLEDINDRNDIADRTRAEDVALERASNIRLKIVEPPKTGQSRDPHRKV
jgi:hypothetical protein